MIQKEDQGLLNELIARPPVGFNQVVLEYGKGGMPWMPMNLFNYYLDVLKDAPVEEEVKMEVAAPSPPRSGIPGDAPAPLHQEA